MKKTRSGKAAEQPKPPPCTCPSASTWTERQQQAFGPMPVKFRQCPRHG